jgi:DNA-binding NarL/FixJ family response regulator
MEQIPFCCLDEGRRHLMAERDLAAGGTGLNAILTPRELDVLLLVCKGFSNKKIAQQLRVSEGTVKQHVHRILAKTGRKNRYQLILSAR